MLKNRLITEFPSKMRMTGCYYFWVCALDFPFEQLLYLWGSQRDEEVDLFYKAPEYRMRITGWNVIGGKVNLELRSNFLSDNN